MDGLTIGPGLASGGGLAGTGGKIISPQGLAYPGGLTIGPVAPPPTGATWSPTNKNVNVVLSNNDLTADGSGFTSVNLGVGIATKSITTGNLIYFEVAADVVDNSSSDGIGVANASVPLTTGDWLGFDANSLGFFADGRVLYGGSTLTTLTGYASSAVLCIAVRFNDGTIFRRINGGNWNDNVSADPSTNTGGLTTGITGDLYPAYCAHGDGTNWSQVTLHTSASFPVPSGFTYYGV